MNKLLILVFVAGTALFAGDASLPQNADNANKGGPAVPRRDFTPAEIAAVLQSLGVSTDATTTAGTVSCDVEDSTGTITHTVKWAGYPSAPVYWMRYQPDGSITSTVFFVLKPLFAGSPVSQMVQTYLPNSAAEVLAPFAIPFWQNNLTNGNWVLVVKNNLGQSAKFFFKVTN